MMTDSLIQAWRQLWKYPLRTILTLLSLTISIASLPASLALGTGARNIVRADLEKHGGTNGFGIAVDPWIADDRKGYIPNPERLTLEDALALEAECPSITLAMPDAARWPVSARANGKSINVVCVATSESQQEAENWYVEFGRIFSESDVEAARKVCVIGQEVWEQLFPNQNPIGEELRLAGDRYQIIGVMEKRGTVSFRGRDRRIWIPITTGHYRLAIGKPAAGIWNGVGIWVKTVSEDAVSFAMMEAEQVLRKRHRNRKFFRFWSHRMGEWFPNQLSRMLNSGLLGTIAICSILVSGIGLVNVLSASLPLRIREIGLRKAVGATRKAVFAQFTFESVLLCLIGIPMGLATSFGLLEGMSLFVTHYVTQGTAWPVSITHNHLYFGIGLGVGVVFLANLYPICFALSAPPTVSLNSE